MRTGLTLLAAALALSTCTRNKRTDGFRRSATVAARTVHALSTGSTDADFERHLRKLNRRVPAGFTIVVQKPFVVLGDERPAVVRQRSRDTVAWATTRLKALFFTKDPKRIIDVWLFRDAQSYRRHALKLFGDRPSTPYGYYSDTHGALVMNIATGGGTLVHEMVHPFVEANFPDAPPWLNEGMGSLYEACGDKNGRIWGYLNWRLPGLQKALRAKGVPTFAKLTRMDNTAFYRHDSGTNYAQSRYLLYYLQKQGKLVKFYKRFYARRKQDPTGYQTLKEILGNPDMKTFRARWERFTLALKYPPDVRVSLGD